MSRRSVLGAALFLLVACADDSGVFPAADRFQTITPRFTKHLDPFSGFQSPVRLALTPSGGLLVSDSRLAAIVTVDPATLQPDRAMEVRGKPLAVGMLGARIFVGNATTQRIEVYNAKGRFWYAFAFPVRYPTDMAVDTTRNIVFVVDADAHDVKVFDFKGGLLRVFPDPTADPAAHLNMPTGIAVDPELQEVFVSDYPDPTTGGNAAVRIFDYQGTLLKVLSPGKCGSIGCSGGFSRPQGIALDGDDRMYVVDAFLAAVLVFDRATLTLVQTLGGRDAGPPQLRIPLDVVIGVGGDLFATSNRTATVEVFRSGAAP